MVVTCPVGISQRRRIRRRWQKLRASVQRERKIMRCFCIIRYTDSLPAWRTGIRLKHPAGCNEKSPSVARGFTYFREKPFLFPPPLCSSSPSGLNLRVSETGRAVPRARDPLLHLFVQLLFFFPLLLPPICFASRCLPRLVFSRVDEEFYESPPRQFHVQPRAQHVSPRVLFREFYEFAEKVNFHEKILESLCVFVF